MQNILVYDQFNMNSADSPAEGKFVTNLLCKSRFSLLSFTGRFRALSVNLAYEDNYQKQNTRERRIQILFAWLAGAGHRAPFLDAQLELNRRPHALGVLSIMAGILSHDRRARFMEDKYVLIEAQPAQICRAFSCVCAGMVDL